MEGMVINGTAVAFAQIILIAFSTFHFLFSPLCGFVSGSIVSAQWSKYKSEKKFSLLIIFPIILACYYVFTAFSSILYPVSADQTQQFVNLYSNQIRFLSVMGLILFINSFWSVFVIKQRVLSVAETAKVEPPSSQFISKLAKFTITCVAMVVLGYWGTTLANSYSFLSTWAARPFALVALLVMLLVTMGITFKVFNSLKLPNMSYVFLLGVISGYWSLRFFHLGIGPMTAIYLLVLCLVGCIAFYALFHFQIIKSSVKLMISLVIIGLIWFGSTYSTSANNLNEDHQLNNSRVKKMDFTLYFPRTNIDGVTYTGYQYKDYTKPAFMEIWFTLDLRIREFKTPSYFDPPTNCGYEEPNSFFNKDQYPCKLDVTTPKGRDIYMYSSDLKRPYISDPKPEKYFISIDDTVIVLSYFPALGSRDSIINFVDSLEPVTPDRFLDLSKDVKYRVP